MEVGTLSISYIQQCFNSNVHPSNPIRLKSSNVEGVPDVGMGRAKAMI